MKIAVIGTGYVGLVTGTCFAETGNFVTCVDVDIEKVALLKEGHVPIYEPGLERLMKRNISEGRLNFTTSTAAAVKDAVVVFLAVGTPPGPDGNADLSQIRAAAEAIADGIDGYRVIAVKSTVPVGTNDMVRSIIEARTEHPFDIASNPEFLKEGAAVEDCLKPDRIVVGCGSERARKVMLQLYGPYVRTENPVLFMDIRSAELTKYAANGMLALRISFMNELARLSEKVGADITQVRRGIGSDRRIGRQFLFPGVGYGGSCFPKDVQALVKTGVEYDSPLRIMEAVEEVNLDQKKILFEKIHAYFGGDLEGKTIGVWGLAFKPNTDDMREAPSLTLISALLEAGAKVKAFDPAARDTAGEHLGDSIEFCNSSYEAVDGADVLAVVTEWNEFRMPDFKRIKSLLVNPAVFDGRNLFDPIRMADMGFHYECIGRQTISQKEK